MFELNGPNADNFRSFLASYRSGRPFEIRTSGSTGEPKKILLEPSKLRIAARRTSAPFAVKEGEWVVNALSHETVGGLMMVARGIERGWKVYCIQPSVRPLRDLELSEARLINLVPNMLYESLLNDQATLRAIPHILLGGAPLTTTVEHLLLSSGISAVHGYGMTETYSFIASRQTSQSDGIYHCLPGVTVSQNKDGTLVIHDMELGHEALSTTDRAEVLNSQNFRFLGRTVNIINSGAVKLHLEDLEKTWSKWVDVPFVLAGEPDEIYGTRLVLFSETPFSLSKESIKSLKKTEIPKRFYQIPNLFKRVGKLKRQNLAQNPEKKEYDPFI